jgi:hypothetical protein
MRLKLIIALVAAGVGATGCAQRPPTRPAPTPTPTPTPTPMPMPIPPSLTLETAVQAALADASRRTGLAVEALQLHSAEAVTWRDGALGCPQPGRAYTQALVPGYRVRIRAQGQLLHYHAGSRGAVLLCPADRAVEPLPDDSRR